MFARKNRVSAAFYDFFRKKTLFLRLYLKAESTNTIKATNRIPCKCRLLCVSLKNHALKGQDSLPKPYGQAEFAIRLLGKMGICNSHR